MNTAAVVRALRWLPGLLPVAVAAQGAGEGGVVPPLRGPVNGYVVGAAVTAGRDHVGQGGYALSLQPVWGVWVGRFRLSTGGATALWGVGRAAVVDAGLSTTLVSRSDWSLGASLRWDEGRRVDEADSLLRGVPAVRATLRGQLALGYALSPRWSASAGVSQDLLGRGRGAQVSAGLTYRHPLSPRTYWDFTWGIRAGDATYLGSLYGLSPEAAARAGRMLHEPAAGVEGVQLGWRIVAALNHDWVAYGGIGVSRLVGDAARSPLVGARQIWSANIGVAYRH